MGFDVYKRGRLRKAATTRETGSLDLRFTDEAIARKSRILHQAEATQQRKNDHLNFMKEQRKMLDEQAALLRRAEMAEAAKESPEITQSLQRMLAKSQEE